LGFGFGGVTALQTLRGTVPHLTAYSKALCKMPCIRRTLPEARPASSLAW
jgi:hypothetical protein